MIQEEKELLLKDLCTRLPYKVKGFAEHGVFKGIVTLRNINIDNDSQPIACYNNYGSLHVKVGEFKPYLFPLSSMTEEEKKEYGKACELDTEILLKHPMDETPFPALYNSQDWLDAHHFDYRGLIPMGLAKDATGKNIY